jgi:hypothetical protein
MKFTSAISILLGAFGYTSTGGMVFPEALLAAEVTDKLITDVGQITDIGKVNVKNADKGFVSLFNGKDFSGWVSMGKQEAWQIKNGRIRSDGESGGFWLRSEKKYRNFIWKVDWKISPGGNSGVYLRSAKKDLPWETGYEVQISNDPRDDLHCTGSLYGHAAVNPRPDETPDKWHTFQMRCEDAHITVTCDGVQCVDFDQSKADLSKHKPLEGYIGLQDAHGSKGNYVEYRNIKIKVLDKATP